VINRLNVRTATMLIAVAMAAGEALSAQTGTSTTKPPAKPPAAPAKPAVTSTPAAATSKTSGAGPVIVVETEKGTFEFETYPKEAPKSVEHIVALVKRNFYNGQHIHRVDPGFVIQFGDPATKDMRNVGSPGYGNGTSGKPIGVAEMSPLHRHRLGSVALAHAGNPALADSQLYVVLGTTRIANLDGSYTVIGQVISGMDVVQKIKKNDMIKRITVKAGTPAAKP
jgi:cyclophilin family peptidyl-prolyl cis-trans isomerase